MYRNNNKVFAPFQFKSTDAQQLLSDLEPSQPNVMRRHKWPLLALLLIMILIAICTLPYTTRVNYTLRGAEVSLDGTVVSCGDLVLRGRSQQFLLRQDQFALDGLMLPGREIGNIMDQSFALMEYDGLYFTRVLLTLPEYTGGNNCYTCSLIFPKDQSWFVLQVTDRFFIGSCDENADYAAIMKMCRPFLYS